METKFDMDKIFVVPIESVRPNEWNPKPEKGSGFERVKKALDIMGQRKPIRVRENQGYEIVDGEQRWLALKELGKTEIQVYNLGTLGDDEAKSTTINWEQRVEIDEVLMADLIVNGIIDKTMLPFTESEIESITKLLEHEWTVPETTKEEGILKESHLIGYKFSLSQYEEICKGVRLMMKKESVEDAEALRLCVRMALKRMSETQKGGV